MTIDAAATRLDEARSEQERRLVGQVRDHGWRTTAVNAPEGYAAYSYTTGFWLTFGQPEIITFDLTPELRHSLFAMIARDIGEGRRFAAGEPVTGLLEGEEMWLVPVGQAQADAYLPGTKWLYRDAAFPCWQLVWSDAAGRFPWQDGFDAGLAGVQPDLSAGSDWGGAASASRKVDQAIV